MFYNTLSHIIKITLLSAILIMTLHAMQAQEIDQSFAMSIRSNETVCTYRANETLAMQTPTYLVYMWVPVALPNYPETRMQQQHAIPPMDVPESNFYAVNQYSEESRQTQE